jgi:hypothetical protein
MSEKFQERGVLAGNAQLRRQLSHATEEAR